MIDRGDGHTQVTAILLRLMLSAHGAGEQQGVSYHFVSTEEFEKLLADKQFIEHAKVHNTMYGTSISALQDVAAKNQVAM